MSVEILQAAEYQRLLFMYDLIANNHFNLEILSTWS